MKKTTKLLVGLNVAAASVLAGCGSLSGTENPVYEEHQSADENKEISNKDMPPEVEGCEQLRYDEDEDVWVCDDQESPRYGHYYYGGSFFPTLALLYASSAYRSAISAGTVRPRNPQGPTNIAPTPKPNTTVKPGTSGTNSSGFGTGSKTGGTFGG
ncbi:MAG: hypothetical protein ACI35O_04435 [Bacillaceae bacterium]